MAGTRHHQRRWQRWLRPAAFAYYCAQEFDFSVYSHLRDEVVELGRACIAKDHRNFTVLSMLWRGIAQYALEHNARYLLGCSSLSSQDPADGVAAYAAMQANMSPAQYYTVPCGDYALDIFACVAGEGVPQHVCHLSVVTDRHIGAIP